jgi:single-strand DNA-binding protein
MSVNKVILIGNVGQNPEIRTTQSGTKIANFSLATTDYWKDKANGERKSKTEWHKIVVFSNNLAGLVESLVKKGTKLYIEGSLQTRKWQDQSGVEKFTTEIILQGFNAKIEFLDKKESEGKNDAEETNNDDEVPF